MSSEKPRHSRCGQARKRDAEAELTFAKAEREKIHAIREERDLRRSLTDPDPDEVRAAEETLEAAIKKLWRKGGDAWLLASGDPANPIDDDEVEVPKSRSSAHDPGSPPESGDT